MLDDLLRIAVASIAGTVTNICLMSLYEAFPQNGITFAIPGMAVGAVFYNPNINPLTKVWLNENYPSVMGNITLLEKELGKEAKAFLTVSLIFISYIISADPAVPMIGSMLCVLVLAVFINQYVNRKYVFLLFMLYT